MPQPTSPALSAPDLPSRGLVEDVGRLLGTARRGWPIVAVAVLTCLTVAVVYLARKTTAYQATSRLLILQQGRSPLSPSSGDGGRLMEGVEDCLPTQALILRSPLVVGRALESLGRKDLSVRAVIDRRLTVSRPDPVAKVIQVSYLSDDPEDAEKIIGAVLDSYERFLDDQYHKKNHDVTELLTKARDELSRELQGLEQKYLELLEEAPAQVSDEAGRVSQERRVEQWDRAAGEAELKAVQLRAQLELGRKLADDGASLWAIVQAMGHLSGGASPGAIPQDASDPYTALRIRLVKELTDLELQRVAAERLLEDLARRGSTPEAIRPVDEAELTRRFVADPDVAALRDKLRTAQDRLSAARRVSRNPNDPAARRVAEQIRTLQAELDRLWAQRGPALLEQFDAEARKVEAELAAVRAREQTLKDKLVQLDADILERLEGRKRELTGRLGPRDAQVLALRAQIARLRDGGPEATAHPEHDAIHDLLGAIERSLASVEAMRAEIQGRFAEDLDASKRFEVDRLAITNVQSNLERQRALFNTVVDQLKQVQLASDSNSITNGITAQVIDPPSTSPVRPNAALVLAVALAVGLALGMGSTVVADQLDPRLRSVEEIRQAMDLAVLGLIPRLPGGRLATPGGLGLIGHMMPQSPLAEGFRVIRTNLDLKRRGRPLQVILVTSPLSGDGKSMTASNLAVSLAQAGRRVLLVDADLRRPMLDTIYGLPRDRGLAEVLRDQLPIRQAVQATTVGHLDLISAGPDVPDPAELLISPRLGEFLGAARQAYEAVVIDSPPLLTVTDPVILGGAVDGILLVVRAGAIRRQDAARSIELLEAIGTPTLGTVINGTDRQEGGYGYGYGSYSSPRGAAGPGAGRNGAASLAVPPGPRVSGHATSNGCEGWLE